MDKSPEGRAATAQWHYVKLDTASPDLAKACFGQPELPATTPATHGPQQDCIIDKVNEFARELYDPGTSAGERLMALQFLLNFTGDLHQPLAAIEHGDQGGDCIAVLPPGAKTPVRLSIYWNDVLVTEAEGKDPITAADQIVAGLTPGDITKWSGGTLEDWARESYNIAKTCRLQLSRRLGRRQTCLATAPRRKGFLRGNHGLSDRFGLSGPRDRRGQGAIGQGRGAARLPVAGKRPVAGTAVSALAPGWPESGRRRFRRGHPRRRRDIRPHAALGDAAGRRDRRFRNPHWPPVEVAGTFMQNAFEDEGDGDPARRQRRSDAPAGIDRQLVQRLQTAEIGRAASDTATDA